jgi:hypothetical protein
MNRIKVSTCEVRKHQITILPDFPHFETPFHLLRPMVVLATWHVRSKDRARKQLLSYYNYLRLAADLCLLFELVAILWGKRPQNLLLFVSDFVLKRNTLRQFYECRDGTEMSKVAIAWLEAFLVGL